MNLNFTKMQGAGNDFIVIDDRDGALAGQEKRLSKLLCHRRYSVGADGVIFIRKASLPNCDIEMHYVNADGSYAGMCGNGIRCTAWYFFRRIDDSRKELNIEVAREARPVIIQPTEDRRTAFVTTNMRTPSLKLADIPANIEGTLGWDEWIDKELELVVGFSPKCTLVSMGNPHCVIFLDEGEIDDALVLGKGREIERNVSLFPERVNVEFAKVFKPEQALEDLSYTVKVRVWERGVGETWACASGASAVVVAGVLTDRLPAYRDVLVNMLGGTLTVRWDGRGTPVILRGEAKFSFEGTVEV